MSRIVVFLKKTKNYRKLIVEPVYQCLVFMVRFFEFIKNELSLFLIRTYPNVYNRLKSEILFQAMPEKNFKLMHINSKINSCFSVNPTPVGFIHINNILLLGKSRLLFDTERPVVYSDISENDSLFQLFTEYIFHDELFGICEYHISNETLSFKKISFEPFISLEGQWISLLHHGSENWMHWISEILPRLFVSNELLNDPPSLIIDADLPESIYQSIKQALNCRHIVRVNKHTIVHVTDLLIPEYSSYTLMWERGGQRRSGEWQFDEVALRRMRTKLLSVVKANKNAPQLIYSQRKSNYRHIKDENSLKLALDDLGFLTINTGSMSFIEQIEIFKNCKLLVIQAGATLANLIFMPAGSVAIVLALDSEYVHYKYFEQYAEIFDVSIEYIKCKSANPKEYPHGTAGSTKHPINQDLVYDLNLVRSSVRVYCKALNIKL